MAQINQEKVKSLLEKGTIDEQIESVKELNQWLIEKIKEQQKEFERKLEKLNSK